MERMDENFVNYGIISLLVGDNFSTSNSNENSKYADKIIYPKNKPNK